MSANDSKFSKSKVWLDWLNDDAEITPSETTAPMFRGVPQKTATAPREADRPSIAREQSSARTETPRAHRPPTRSTQRPGHRTSATGVPDRSAYAFGAPVRTVTKPKPTLKDDDALVINLHLPSFTLPKLQIPWKKVGVVAAIVVPLAAFMVAAPYVSRYLNHRKEVSQQESAALTPSYAPLEPQESSTTSGTQYDPKKQLYKYDDTYKGVTLTISQQPLPDDLRDNPTKLKNVAASIGANEKVTAANGTLYVSTDDKLTTQRLVFASRQILVFIQANGVLKNSDWVSYVQSLEAKL